MLLPIVLKHIQGPMLDPNGSGLPEHLLFYIFDQTRSTSGRTCAQIEYLFVGANSTTNTPKALMLNLN